MEQTLAGEKEYMCYLDLDDCTEAGTQGKHPHMQI